MENIKKIKSVLEYDFEIDVFENVSTLLFYLPYTPFDYGMDTETAQIDAFYLASQTAYNKAKEYALKLSSMNIECTANPKLNLKAAAIRCGNGVGKNTLIYRQGIGSRFAIGAIEIKETCKPVLCGDKVHMPCESCNMCAEHCPLNAIGGSFDRIKCMRNYMLKPEEAEEKTLQAFETRILGCDICQRVCPQNSEKSRKLPSDLKNLLNIENLYKELKSKNTEKLAELFGKNYANINSLLSMLIIVAANSGDKKYQSIINENTLHKSKRVQFAVQYALKR